MSGTNAPLICALRSADFSGGVYPPSATSRTISFSILVSFFRREDDLGRGRHAITFDHLSSVLRSFVAPFEKVETKSDNFGNGKCELIANFCTTMVTI